MPDINDEAEARRYNAELKKRVAELEDVVTERKQAADALHRRTEELTTLLKVSHALSTTLEMETVLQTATDSATDLIGIESAAIYLLEGEELYLGATTPPLDPQMPETFRRALIVDHPHIQKSVSTGLPVILADTATADLTAAERAISEERGLRTIFYIPILVGKRAMGILILGAIGKPRAISEAEIDLCRTTANLVAVSIQNASLHGNLIQHSKELKNEIRIRKRSEEALRESEEKYRELFNNANDAILLWEWTKQDTIGRCIEVNDVACQMYGYSRDEFLKMTPDDLTAQESAQQMPGIIKKLSGNRNATFEVIDVAKDGFRIPVEISSHLFALGEKTVLLSIVRDITDRKKLEEMQRLQSEITANMSEGVSLLQKPFSPQSLAEKVREILDEG